MKTAVFFAMLLLSLPLWADQESFQATITCTASSPYKYKDGNDYFYNTSTNYTYLGRKNGKMQKNEETFRMILRMNLSSIPDSALITWVGFYYSFYADSAGANFYYRFGSFPYSTSGSQNEWNACSTGTTYRTDIYTGSSAPSFTYTNYDDTALVMLQMKMEFHKLNECETKNRKFHL